MDANLQETPVNSTYGSSFVGAGVDMRSISTDNVKSVEIVRGIPSVEYGDLTSGLVKIERKQGGKQLEARFKADMSSYLLSMAKVSNGRATRQRKAPNETFNSRALRGYA